MASIELLATSISAGYSGTRIVDDLSIQVHSGERVGIIGRNGAGKTTTLACLMGLAELQGGNIQLGGQTISDWPTYRRARAGLGYVPQTRDIFRSLTVEENLACAAGGKADLARFELVYELFPRLKERRRNGGTDLSGGEQQMLAVGRAMIPGPKVLLMDEPLEGLAPKVREELLESIEQLAVKTGVSCVFVEQHVDVVLSFCSQVLVLERGRPVFSGSSADLRARPEVLESSVGLKKKLRFG